MRGVRISPSNASLSKGPIQQGRSTEVAETTLEALEASLRTAELVLGHTLKGVRRTYDHHSYMEEKKAALEALASLRATIVE
jgi:hypothetical protein